LNGLTWSNHKAPLIVTSQVEPQVWLKVFEDPVIGEAIVDRLIHPSQKIILKGEKSYREKLTENKARLKNQVGSSQISKSLRRFAPPSRRVVPFVVIGWIPNMKSNTKAQSPQTNGIYERFHKTILNEFYRVTFRKKLYKTIEELQADLD
jgi:hypothetical protein